jgi:hypothetical protein
MSYYLAVNNANKLKLVTYALLFKKYLVGLRKYNMKRDIRLSIQNWMDW